MKTIIHVGQHKTGTTSLQSYLRENSNDLIQSGLYVHPILAGNNDVSHFMLNVYALDEDRFSPMKDDVIMKEGREFLKSLDKKLEEDIASAYEEAKNKGCSRVLWSNEGLYLLNSVEEYSRLYDLFSKYSTDIEVVCCFRDLSSYTESYIKHLVKQNISTLSDPDSYRYVETDSWLFDYQRKKQLLTQVFGKCVFFDYDPEDNIKKFMNNIGYDSLKSSDYKLNITKTPYEKLFTYLKNNLIK